MCSRGRVTNSLFSLSADINGGILWRMWAEFVAYIIYAVLDDQLSCSMAVAIASTFHWRGRDPRGLQNTEAETDCKLPPADRS
jgi:hypothetical protein